MFRLCPHKTTKETLYHVNYINSMLLFVFTLNIFIYFIFREKCSLRHKYKRVKVIIMLSKLNISLRNIFFQFIIYIHLFIHITQLHKKYIMYVQYRQKLMRYGVYLFYSFILFRLRYKFFIMYEKGSTALYIDYKEQCFGKKDLT